MKKKFKKIMSVVGSIFLVGSTIGLAFAAGGGAFPSPFIQDNNADFALVYGAGAAASDVTASNSINDYLKTFVQETTTSSSSTTKTSITGDFSDSVGLTDNEIPLGGFVTANDIGNELEDNKISTLFDGEIKWDDGVDSKRYDLHEVIILGDGLKTQTTLDNNEFTKPVVLSNDQALTYKLIFDDDFVLNRIGDYDEDADELYLTILGQEYEILGMDSNSITVSLAEQITVEVGGSFVVDGITLTVNDIFDDTIQVNGNFIKEERTKTVDGIKVYVENIAYHSSIEGYTNKVILKVGKDIEKEFENGDEYYEDDETWEWTIENPGKVGGHIGVKYVRNSVGYDEDEEQDNAIEPGMSYVFPENYAAVFFNGLTDVNYENFELSFDDKSLYNGNSSTKQSNQDVAILQGEKDESFELSNGWETDSLYFKYTEDGVELYFKDIDGDIDSDKEGRIQFSELFNFGDVNVTTNETVDVSDVITLYGAPILGYEYYDGVETYDAFKLGEDTFFYVNSSILPTIVDGSNVITIESIVGYEYYDGTTNHTVTKDGDVYSYEVTTTGSSEDVICSDIATLIVDDTELQLGLNLNLDKTVDLTFTNDEVNISIPLGHHEGVFDRLGILEDSDTTNLVVNGNSIGTYEDDVMDHYGIVYKSPEYNADREKIIFDVPSEQVYADISVLGKGSEITNTTVTENNETVAAEVVDFGGVIVKDTEVNSVKDKNLIIVGGSCINAEAAKLLGGKACGEEFTLKTGIIPGQAMIQSFVSPYNTGKVAIVVAGYEAADTTRAASSFINTDMDLAIGQKYAV